jgi:hypothetical protein
MSQTDRSWTEGWAMRDKKASGRGLEGYKGGKEGKTGVRSRQLLLENWAQPQRDHVGPSPVFGKGAAWRAQNCTLPPQATSA